jgi:hypothetical protein
MAAQRAGGRCGGTVSLVIAKHVGPGLAFLSQVRGVRSA